MQKVDVPKSGYLEGKSVLASLETCKHQLKNTGKVAVVDDLTANIGPGPAHPRGSARGCSLTRCSKPARRPSVASRLQQARSRARNR